MVYGNIGWKTMDEKQLLEAIKEFANKYPQINLSASDAQKQLVEYLIVKGANNANCQRTCRKT
tara:strand:+ start:2413 stop:2601 length:189 start_codon:yes stop_codon:yes gene_type:complete